jgi:hypothetical protein
VARCAVEQGDEADEAGASDGASQLIPGVRRARAGLRFCDDRDDVDRPLESGPRRRADLRACAEVWGHSIERMLAEDHPTIRYVSRVAGSRGRSISSRAFTIPWETSHRRVTLVKALSELDALEWSRSATFTATQGRESIVLRYARRIADHEWQHIAQIHRTVKGWDTPAASALRTAA